MSAMRTKFALAKLDVTMPDGCFLTFYFDGNGKITRENGSFASPAPNAFSLVQVEDCPYATPTCKSVCYVHRLEEAEAKVHDAYKHNSRVIREVLENDCYFLEAVSAFSTWIRANSKKGFRWHVSGDIISEKHTLFIGSVCDAAPEVPFWIYTRSFVLLRPFLYPKTNNLVINLSADKDNYKQALLWHKEFGLRICYLTVDGEIPEDLPNGSVIFPSHELRGYGLTNPKEAPWWKTLRVQQKRMVCPPDFFGQSERLRCGPCKKCLV